MNLVKLLANNWQPIAIIALIGTGLAVSHHQGYKSAFAKQQAVIDKMEKDKAQALLLSAQNYARELEQSRAEAKKYEETFAKFLSPNSRNLNTGFRLFLFQISTDSTQIPP